MLCDTDKFAQRVVSEFCECGHMILAHSEGGLCAPCAMVSAVVYSVMEGDVVVYTCDALLKVTEIENIHRSLRELFPSNMVGIIDGGGKLAIVRGDE